MKLLNNIYFKFLISTILIVLLLIYLINNEEYVTYFNRSYKIILVHYSVSIMETLTSIVLSIVLSLFIFIISLKFSFIRSLTIKGLIIFQTIPLIVLAPTLLSIFGFSYVIKIVIVAILGMYPILVNIDRSYLDIPSDMFLFTKLANISPFKNVILPSISTSLFSGIKLSASYSFASILLTEFIGGRYGLGIYLTNVLKNFDYYAIFTIVFISIITTFILIKLVDILSYLFLKYKYGGLLI